MTVDGHRLENSAIQGKGGFAHSESTFTLTVNAPLRASRNTIHVLCLLQGGALHLLMLHEPNYP